MSLINQKRVKQFFKDNGKQLSREGLESIEDMLQLKLRASILNAKHFTRVKEVEVLTAFGRVKV